MTANAFAMDEPEVVEGFYRNGRGEPLITMPDGSVKTYSRASTFSNYLEDKTGIARWEAAHAVLGVAKSDLLIDKLRPLEYEGNSKLIAEYIDEAHVVARLHAKADYGTSMHAYLDPATDPMVVPWNRKMREDLRTAREFRDHLGATVLGTEVRVVNDAIGAAGTYDGLWDVPGLGAVTIDYKSGKFSPLSWTIQQAIYRDGVHYDVESGERTPITPTPRADIALIVHIPRGEANPKIYPVDLNLGRELIQDALRIRKIRSAAWQKNLVVKWTPGEMFDAAPTLMERIVAATTQAELAAVMKDPQVHDGHKTTARERWTSLPAV